MEDLALIPYHREEIIIEEANNTSSNNAFITANTISCPIGELKEQHIIPVFIKDNEPVISQMEFIEVTNDVVASVFAQERVLEPSIRVSHPIKGRIPEAKHKPANALEDSEKTLYYEDGFCNRDTNYLR